MIVDYKKCSNERPCFKHRTHVIMNEERYYTIDADEDVDFILMKNHPNFLQRIYLETTFRSSDPSDLLIGITYDHPYSE